MGSAPAMGSRALIKARGSAGTYAQIIQAVVGGRPCALGHESVRFGLAFRGQITLYVTPPETDADTRRVTERARRCAWCRARATSPRPRCERRQPRACARRSEFALQHDELLFALMAVRRNDATRAYAHEAHVRARTIVPVQLADFHERADLDPRSLTRTQRASAFGGCSCASSQQSTAHPLALPCAELRRPHRAGECFLKVCGRSPSSERRLLQSGSSETHMASSDSRS